MSLLRRLYDLIKTTAKSNTSLPKSVLSRLDRAFDAYIQAYGARQMRFLTPYFNRGCIQKLAPSIYNEDRFFATSRFRRVTWELIAKKGSLLTVKQNIEFDKIRAAGFSINVSQSYQETWTINTDNNLVESVLR